MLKVKKHKQVTADMLQRKSSVATKPYGGYNFGDSSKVKELNKQFENLNRQFNVSQQSSQTQNTPGSGAPGWLGAASGAISGITKNFTQMNKTANPTSLAIRDSISDAAIQSGIPMAMAIGAATKVVDAIGDATGFHIDDIDKDAGNRAGVNGGIRFLNNAMNAIPGNSLVMAALSPDKTGEMNSLNEEGESVLAGYSGVRGDINAAQKLSGIRTLFGIGSKKIGDYIVNSRREVDVINEIGRTNSLAKQSDYGTNIAQQNLNRYAGTNYQTYAVGKKGMKIMSRKELSDILATRKLQKGGVIGTDTNLLPEGSLHARLNHLQDVSPDLEDTTRKGIPVLDEKGEQVAEIESNELILNKSLTDKLEELLKDGSDDAMIEAGKLLVHEILDNTQDNTGQITEEV